MVNLPVLDLDNPLPEDQVIPLGFQAAYLALHETFLEIWRPKSIVEKMVDTVAGKLALNTEQERGHVIG